MEYSVEALAKLSRISVRTLHYYDEIGLLNPLIRMVNGRRYYGTQQFLQLQRILYFKEIGFSLKKIKSILALKNVSQVSLLSAQKEVLEKEIKRLERLTKSIDRTIEHYKGCTMSEEEICNQFDNIESKVKEHVKIAEEKFGKELMDKSRKIMESMNKEEMTVHQGRILEIINKIVAAINNNIEPSSEEAQDLMQEYVSVVSVLTPMTRELYLTSREAILEDLGPFSARKLHQKFPEYMYEAMGVFANNHFPE